MHYLFLPLFYIASLFSSELASSSQLQGPLSPDTKKYTLCIGAIFNNEAPYLKEWIEYHLLLGAEHFFLYNNDSSDDYLTVLEPYLNQNIVELREWASGEKESDWLNPQRQAYNHCIKHCEQLTEWLALIDIDEFIVPVDKPDLIAYLAQFNDQPSIGGIQVNWQLYGTSWLPVIPKNKLLIESLTLKAPWNYSAPWGRGPNNRLIKSIVRPHAVEAFSIHHAIRYNPGFTIFPPKKDGEKGSPIEQCIQIEHIRINHYWTRSEDFFYNVKLNRQFKRGALKDKQMNVIPRTLEELNQEKDLIMMRFVPLLRQRMFPEEL